MKLYLLMNYVEMLNIRLLWKKIKEKIYKYLIIIDIINIIMFKIFQYSV